MIVVGNNMSFFLLDHDGPPFLAILMGVNMSFFLLDHNCPPFLWLNDVALAPVVMVVTASEMTAFFPQFDHHPVDLDVAVQPQLPTASGGSSIIFKSHFFVGAAVVPVKFAWFTTDARGGGVPGADDQPALTMTFTAFGHQFNFDQLIIM